MSRMTSSLLADSTLPNGVQDDDWPGWIIISALHRIRHCGLSNPLFSWSGGERS